MRAAVQLLWLSSTLDSEAFYVALGSRLLTGWDLLVLYSAAKRPCGIIPALLPKTCSDVTLLKANSPATLEPVSGSVLHLSILPCINEHHKMLHS